MIKRRRDSDNEDFGMPFLAMICCGFGGLLLLLMVTETSEPALYDKSLEDLEARIAVMRDALLDSRDESDRAKLALSDKQVELDEAAKTIQSLRTRMARIEQEIKQSEEQEYLLSERARGLSSARQSLTEQMLALQATAGVSGENAIGGITADSEYIIFVIDTSGSMFSYAWEGVRRKVGEVLAIYPEVKGIQVMNDMGDYMFRSFAGRWMPDSPTVRRQIVDRLASWNPFSNSSPVEGIQRAISAYYDPSLEISIYVFGDDFQQGNTIQSVVDAVDRANRTSQVTGRRRVRIHAVGFPVGFEPNAPPELRGRAYRFAALMRELTHRNLGAFVGAAELQ